jgi:hypothetical protein
MSDNPSVVPILPPLPGEMEPETHQLRSSDGAPARPDYAIFPIVRYDPDSKVHLVGTGFFISTNGVFGTARHVLTGAFDSKGRQRHPMGILQFIEGNIFIARPILRFARHPVADLAVGVAAPMARTRDGAPLTNPVLKLTTVRPATGTKIVTYAYPKHLNVIDSGRQFLHLQPAFYDGCVEEYLPNGRDRTMLPGPCYRTNIIIHAGASGGPVFGPTGVFAVNSSGFDGTDISYVSRINEILQLTIDGVVLGAAPARSVPVIDLARAGHIVFSRPLARPVGQP